MYASVPVDGFIADEQDQPRPLVDWLPNGEVPLCVIDGVEAAMAKAQEFAGNRVLRPRYRLRRQS